MVYSITSMFTLLLFPTVPLYQSGTRKAIFWNKTKKFSNQCNLTAQIEPDKPDNSNGFSHIYNSYAFIEINSFYDIKAFKRSLQENVNQIQKVIILQKFYFLHTVPSEKHKLDRK